MSEIRITTESGSVYLLNKPEMTWSRVKYDPTLSSDHPVRTAGGKLVHWPEIIIGREADLLGPPLTEGATIRLIRTSPVVKMEEVSAN